MKKSLTASMVYMIAAICGGVFFREFTKFNGFTETTRLSFVHTHLFMLGMVVFLLSALFCRGSELESNRLFRRFFPIYNIGVGVAAAMLFLRGTLEVLRIPVTGGLDASFSGIAGLAHILITLGLVFFFLALRQTFLPKAAAAQK